MPGAVSVLEGSTVDQTTLLAREVREQFCIATLVMLGDRGMIPKAKRCLETM
jgi:hypothetical protein